MTVEQLSIFPQYPNADLVAYLQRNDPENVDRPRPAMIVCPGGGYLGLSPREDEPIALSFLAEGFQAFVLHYGVGEHAQNCEPLIEACSAIRYVRENAARFGVDPNRIYIVGFSAGGHCAASAGTLWNHPAVREAFAGADTHLGRPDGTVLAYPVITAVNACHYSSFVTLTGSENVADHLPWSLETQVDDETAPAFIWHTANDSVVPVVSSLCYATALAAHHVPFELHVFPDGVHGLSLCDERTGGHAVPALCNPVAAEWVSLAVRWLKKLP